MPDISPTCVMSSPVTVTVAVQLIVPLPTTRYIIAHCALPGYAKVGSTAEKVFSAALFRGFGVDLPLGVGRDALSTAATGLVARLCPTPTTIAAITKSATGAPTSATAAAVTFLRMLHGDFTLTAVGIGAEGLSSTHSCHPGGGAGHSEEGCQPGGGTQPGGGAGQLGGGLNRYPIASHNLPLQPRTAPHYPATDGGTW